MSVSVLLFLFEDVVVEEEDEDEDEVVVVESAMAPCLANVALGVVATVTSCCGYSHEIV